MTFTTRPELLGTFGMVASTHWLAATSGMAVLEAGGNAFDAAVAAGLVLQVVEPHLNGPGGEVPIIFYSADLDRVRVVAGQGPAPAGARIDAFRALGLELVPGTGLLPACVPGAFDGWMRMLLEHGTAPLRDVMSFAIGYSGRGYPLVPGITAAIEEVEHLFREEWPTSAEVYLDRRGAPRPGSLWRNRALSETFARIVTEAEAASPDRDGQIEAARRIFYEGFVAVAIDDFVAGAEVMDTSDTRHRGFLTGADMSAWSAPVEDPVTHDYRGFTVCKTGAWGQGPVFLQQLSLLDGSGIEAMKPNGVDYVHTIVESAKLAFADREAYYGDPDFVDVPLDGLLDPRYAERRRSSITDEASLELEPGRVPGHVPRLASEVRAGDSNASSSGAGEPTLARAVGRDTCHVDVADRHGNIVSATPSGGWLQSSPVIPSLGFCLGTRAQMFWLTEGLPNSLEPGKRPRTTLSPSLALRDGHPYMAFGTPGGDQQDQWSLLFFLDHAHLGSNLQAAIDAPSFHTNHFPSSFYPRAASPGEVVVEGRLERDVIDGLTRRGHRVVVDEPWSLGRVSAVARDEDGLLKAAANARGMQGYAIGR
ncbi:gamma-glutamyltransferase [soil metagenome]